MNLSSGIILLDCFVAVCAWGYWGTRASSFINHFLLLFIQARVLIAVLLRCTYLILNPSSVQGKYYGLLNGLASVSLYFLHFSITKWTYDAVVLVTSMYQ